MTDAARGGRRAGRPPGRPARRPRRGGAVPHPHAAAVRGAERRGHRDHRAQRRHDPRRGRRDRPRLPRGARAVRATPAPTSTASACASRAACAARSCQATAPAVYTQHARNPARNVQIGGDATVFAPNYGSPFVHDLDAGPPLRHARRLRELREARVPLAQPAPLGRHGVRARRHPGQQAAPRHGVRAPALQRQAVHGLGHRRAAGPTTASSWPASASVATSADRTVMTSLINASSPLVWDATMLAAAQVYAADNQACHHHAVHPRRRDGAGHHRRRRRADAGRGARRHDVRAARAARARRSCSGRSRRRCRCRPARRRSARPSRRSSSTSSRSSPAASACRSARAARCARRSCPTRRPRTSRRTRCRRRCSAASTSCCTPPGWLEGGLAIGYEKFVLDDDQLGMMAHVRARRRPLRQRPGARRHPRERARAALPRHRAHARQLRDRVLPLDHRRQRELRAVARRRRARRRAAGQRDLEAARSPSTSRRRSTPRSTRSCATFVARRKSEMPDEIG